ncbi:WAS/WASL-interacting protein family member 1-like [Mustela erminea]|uniref:WAS/WASL-interacting protein family member 1-like n=1 Tax=Mustela erminea TaxID=36723 RepID=UPI001386A6C5|nr:WAS/WASL-interacting protein family member 1-like [Mustela erminea]
MQGSHGGPGFTEREDEEVSVPGQREGGEFAKRPARRLRRQGEGESEGQRWKERLAPRMMKSPTPFSPASDFSPGHCSVLNSAGHFTGKKHESHAGPSHCPLEDHGAKRPEKQGSCSPDDSSGRVKEQPRSPRRTPGTRDQPRLAALPPPPGRRRPPGERTPLREAVPRPAQGRSARTDPSASTRPRRHSRRSAKPPPPPAPALRAAPPPPPRGPEGGSPPFPAAGAPPRGAPTARRPRPSPRAPRRPARPALPGPA